MPRPRWIVPLFVLCLSGFCLSGGNSPPTSRFDKLDETDRAAFSARFAKEVWPLLVRNGKDGCVGCHTQKHISGLRFTGMPDADFRKILRDGFFLPNDPGSMLAMVSNRDEKQRMPPGNRPRWSAEEIQRLREFVNDLAKKQK